MGTIKDHVAVIVNNVGWISSEVFGNTWPSHPHSQHTRLNADDHVHYMLNTAGVNRQFTGDVYFQERLIGNTTLILDDHFRTLQSTWTHEGIDLSRDQSEWVTFFNRHGNVSLLQALSQATSGLDQFAIGFGSAADILTGDAVNFHYTATRQVHIGSATPAYLASTNDSLFVAGQTELTGSVFEMGDVWALGDTRFSTGTLTMYDGRPLCFGTGSDAQMGFYSADESFQIGVPTATNYLIICQKKDLGHPWARTAETNPTLIIQSADEDSHGKNLKLRHGGTDGEVESGSGSIRFIEQNMQYGSWDPAIGLRIGDSADWAAAKALAGGVETTLLDLIIHAAGVGGCTLDGAYDHGGAGAGYFINVDTNQLSFYVPEGNTSVGALRVSCVDAGNTNPPLQVWKANTTSESIEFLGAGGSVAGLGTFPPSAPGHLLYTAGDAITILKYRDDELYPSYGWLSLRKYYSEVELYRTHATFGTANASEAAKSQIYADTWYSGSWQTHLHISTEGYLDIVSEERLILSANTGFLRGYCGSGQSFISGDGTIIDADDTTRHASISVNVGTYPSVELYLQTASVEAWLSLESSTSFHPELSVYGDLFTLFGEDGLNLETEATAKLQAARIDVPSSQTFVNSNTHTGSATIGRGLASFMNDAQVYGVNDHTPDIVESFEFTDSGSTDAVTLTNDQLFGFKAITLPANCHMILKIILFSADRILTDYVDPDTDAVGATLVEEKIYHVYRWGEPPSYPTGVNQRELSDVVLLDQSTYGGGTPVTTGLTLSVNGFDSDLTSGQFRVEVFYAGGTSRDYPAMHHCIKCEGIILRQGGFYNPC